MAIDPKKIAEWEALAEAATPGPWTVVGPELGEPAYVSAVDPRFPEDGTIVVFGGETTRGDGEDMDRDFILASREALPALLSERGELLTQVEQLVGDVRTVSEDYTDVRRERESLLSLLREVEWVRRENVEHGVRECPRCWRIHPDDVALAVEDGWLYPEKIAGHASDCRLAAFLREG